jgi:serine/threonine protein kinase
MGMVYLAEDLTLNKEAAVKVNFSTGEESTGQFLQEARLLARLHHPNLPRVTDHFVEDPCQYLVMDYLPGLDLQTWLERNGRQPWKVMLPLADQLADALYYMHTQRPPIIHRDIKPANIKLRADGSAVLVDFGIAKAADASQKTSIGARGYTPGFAPPEQAGGSRTGPYSDQYALAATLYNMLTGVRPVDSVKRVLDNEKIPDAGTLNVDIPRNVSDALIKAMSIKPEDRFDSVMEFLSALHDPDYIFVKSTRPVTRKSPRNRLAALLIVGSLFVVLAGVTLFAFSGEITNDTQQATPVSTIAAVEVTPPPVISPSAQPSGVAEAKPTEPGKEPRSMLAGGKFLVFSSNLEDGKTMQIWLLQAGLNKDGKPEAVSSRQLTTSGGDKIQPAWSPDGKFVLYTAPAMNGSLANGLDIWRVSVTGGDAVDLTNLEGDEMYAAWSPDGKTICFTASVNETGKKQLYLMDADGRNIRAIKSGYLESQGLWMPDMKALFHVITAGNTTYFAQRSAESKYEKTAPFDTNQSHGRLGQVNDPAFSPDGSRVAYTRSKNRDHWIGVVEYQSKGANFSLITKTGKDYDPSWSTDGRWIAFTSERDGLAQIYIMTSAGLIQTGVSELTATAMYPAWQP